MECEAIERLLSVHDGRLPRGHGLHEHLLRCARCRGFREAIRTRRVQLAVLAPPLPAAAGNALLRDLLRWPDPGGGLLGLSSGRRHR